MMEYYTLPKAPALLKPHDQLVQFHIQDIHWGSLILLQRGSQCILRSQLTGQQTTVKYYSTIPGTKEIRDGHLLTPKTISIFFFL